MLTAEDASRLQKLRSISLEALRLAIEPHSQVAIIDAPNQRNVGDSLILAGELAYLQQMGIRVSHVSDLWTYDPKALRRAMPSGVVLLHGGGNFGDLWPGHQVLREMVVKDLPDYRIVQLPQSIHFRSAESISRARLVFQTHTDLRLLFRESKSMNLASEMFPDTRSDFCPDMAFGWSPASESPEVVAKTGAGNLLGIARSDHEGSSGLAGETTGWSNWETVRFTDWTEPNATRSATLLYETTRRANLLFRGYARARRRYFPRLPVDSPDRLAFATLKSINDQNIASAAALYGSASAVITDRLHAHILAVLMGVPHAVLDNSYGKVSSIFAEYSGDFSSARFFNDVSDAKLNWRSGE